MALVPFPSAPRGRSEDDDPQIELTDPEPLEDDSSRMSFLEHLDELRKRLIYSVVSLLAGCVVSFIFLDRIFDFVFGPMKALIPSGGRFIATEAPEVFMLRLKIGVLGGLFVALPLILWQLWLFIAPGLYANEKRFAIPFVVFASLFFFVGAYFSHRIAFPWTLQYFFGYESDLVTFAPKLAPTFGLYMKMVLGFGAIFQMPILVLVLARMKVVTAGFLLRNFKYAFLIIFIVGAVISPGGDVVSQAMMAGPMLVLYILSIAIAWAVAPRKRAASA